MSSILINPGILIDALITTNIKLYMAQSKKKKKFCNIRELNIKRHRLINEINENFYNWLNGEDIFPLNTEIKDY